MTRSPRPSRSCTGWRTTTSPCWGCANTASPTTTSPRMRWKAPGSASSPIQGQVLRRGRELVAITPEIRDSCASPRRSSSPRPMCKSRVHRRVHLDYVGVKLFSPDGRSTGEFRIVGLFTVDAPIRARRVRSLISHKVAARHPPRRLRPDEPFRQGAGNVLESYPRDELFQVDVDTLLSASPRDHELYERPRVRVLARPDRFDRFVSILVFVPRDRYDSTVRQRVGDLLAEAFKGRLSAAYPVLSRRTAGAHALHHRARRAARRRDRPRRRSRPQSTPSCAPGATGCARRCAGASTGACARGCSRYSDAFTAGLPRGLRARRVARRHRHHRKAGAGPPALASLRAPQQDGRRSTRQPEGLRLRKPDAALRAGARAREPRLPRRQRAHLSGAPNGAAT